MLKSTMREIDNRIGSRPTILIITDSLGFPRCEPEIVKYNDTYVKLLKDKFVNCDIIHVGRGGGTICELFKHTADYHQTLDPLLVIFQVGIVDCAPRAMTRVEIEIIKRILIISPIVRFFIKKYAKQIRKLRQISYTPVNIFDEYVNKFENVFKNVFWLGILPASKAYEVELNGITEQVLLYNSILEKINLLKQRILSPKILCQIIITLVSLVI